MKLFGRRRAAAPARRARQIPLVEADHEEVVRVCAEALLARWGWMEITGTRITRAGLIVRTQVSLVAPEAGYVMADALAPAPAPLPEHVRAGLQSDRALHPPIPDAWRRRVDTVTAVLAPCGAGVVQVSPHILGPEADQQVYVHAWAEVAPAVRGLLRDAGYRLRVYENMPQACLVLSPTRPGSQP